MACREGDWKSLGDGQLPNSTDTLYSPPTGPSGNVSALLFSIVLVNVSAGVVTVNLYKTPGATRRRIIAPNLSLAVGDSLVVAQDITLGPGELLEGDCNTASAVDYTVNGAEKRPE